MKIALAYICVVLVWSTTPIAIQWSNDSLSFIAAISLRVVIAALICAVMLRLWGNKLIRKRSDWHALFAGAFGLFPNMVLVYWSAQFIPSGLIAVILGAYPFFVGVFSLFILKENTFTVERGFALIIAVVGLGLIHVEQFSVDRYAALGVLGIFLSAIFFAVSTVYLKSVGGGIEPLRQLSGTLMIAAPCFIATWFFTDATLPVSISIKSLLGVSYLVFGGSIAGGLTFYYVLSHCKVEKVALIPLMTPIAALLIGRFVGGERLDELAWVGSGLVLVSLGFYQGVFKQLANGNVWNALRVRLQLSS